MRCFRQFAHIPLLVSSSRSKQCNREPSLEKLETIKACGSHVDHVMTQNFSNDVGVGQLNPREVPSCKIPKPRDYSLVLSSE